MYKTAVYTLVNGVIMLHLCQAWGRGVVRYLRELSPPIALTSITLPRSGLSGLSGLGKLTAGDLAQCTWSGRLRKMHRATVSLEFPTILTIYLLATAKLYGFTFTGTFA